MQLSLSALIIQMVIFSEVVVVVGTEVIPLGEEVPVGVMVGGQVVVEVPAVGLVLQVNHQLQAGSSLGQVAGDWSRVPVDLVATIMFRLEEEVQAVVADKQAMGIVVQQVVQDQA
jgi:hypothetical protein